MQSRNKREGKYANRFTVMPPMRNHPSPLRMRNWVKKWSGFIDFMYQDISDEIYEEYTDNLEEDTQ